MPTTGNIVLYATVAALYVAFVILAPAFVPASPQATVLNVAELSTAPIHTDSGASSRLSAAASATNGIEAASSAAASSLLQAKQRAKEAAAPSAPLPFLSLAAAPPTQSLHEREKSDPAGGPAISKSHGHGKVSSSSVGNSDSETRHTPSQKQKKRKPAASTSSSRQPYEDEYDDYKHEDELEKEEADDEEADDEEAQEQEEQYKHTRQHRRRRKGRGKRSDHGVGKYAEEKRTAPGNVHSKNFLCSSAGRALPVLFAGIQKSGSSTMFEDLWSTLSFRTDLPCIQKKDDYWWGCKEPHLLVHGGIKKPSFSSVWGSCGADRRGVLADFTPENFYFPYVPYRLRKIYGRSGSQELVFVMGLRAPLSRMLAAFSGGIRSGWIYHHERPNLTFAEHVSEFLQEWDTRGQSKWLSTLWRTNDYRTVDQGLYYFKLRHYLAAGFHPSQFIIYPARLYLDHRQNMNTNPVLEAIRRKLGKSVLRPLEKINATEITNRGKHDKLEEELPDQQMRHRLREEVFAPANHRLMSLLAEKVSEGMVLVGYKGKAGDVAAVTEWMTSMWDL